MIKENEILSLGFEKDDLHDCIVIFQSESNVAIEYFCEEEKVYLVGYNSAEEMEHIESIDDVKLLLKLLTGLIF